MLRDPEARLRPLYVILEALTSQWMDGKSQHRAQIGFPRKSLWDEEELTEHLLGNALRIKVVGGRERARLHRGDADLQCRFNGRLDKLYRKF